MNQTVDVAACIAELIMEQGKATLPGLGSFSGVYAPARVDQVLGQLDPPRFALDFDASQVEDNGQLVSWISMHSAISSLEAIRVVDEFVQRTIVQLHNKELVVFPRVGRLRLDFEGNFQFLPDTANLNPGAFGLPELHILPVKQSSPVVDVAVAVDTAGAEILSTPVAKPSYSRQRSTGIFLGLGILALTVVVYILFRPQIDDLLTAQAGKQAPQVAQRTTQLAVVSSIAPPSTEDSSTQSIQQQRNPGRADAPNPGRMDTCIIGLGLFQEQKNVERLVERVEQAGFLPYTATRGTLTRVGVQFAYSSEEEIAEVLKTVQTKLEPSAFVWKK